MISLLRQFYCFVALALAVAGGASARDAGQAPPSRQSPPVVIIGQGVVSDFSPLILRSRNGYIIRITRGGVTQSFGRGPGGRVTSATSNVPGARGFAYPSHDAQGRRIAAHTNRGNWTYGYRGGVNGDGQLQTATHTGDWDFEYQHDGIGRRTAFKMPGGIEEFETGNANDPLNRFLSTQWTQQRILRASLDREADVEITESHALPTLLPGLPADPQLPLRDIIFPLTSPGTQGGWTAWSITGTLEGGGDPGAAPDRKAKLAGLAWFPPAEESFTYDNAGNRSGSARWSYTYDGLNRLTRAVNKDLATAPEAHDVLFTYDAEGRRHGKTSKRYSNGSLKAETHTTWTWDGWHPVIERIKDKHGRLLVERKLVWGPDLSAQLGGAGSPAIALATAGGAGGLLLIRETNHSFDGRPPVTTDLLPLYDGSGNIVGLANPAGGLLAEYWYGPFGELLEATGPAAQSNPWRWATKYLDEETGLYYFGLRYYDPVTGQWLSREPLGEGESVNLYSYCHNDPVNRVDVLGMAEYEREQAENLLALRAAAELQPISWVAYDRARWQFSSQLASSGGPWARYVFLTHGEERFIDWDARMEHGADKVFSNAMPALVTAGGLGQMAAGAFLLVVPEPTMATKVAGWYNLGAGADLLGGYWLTDDHKGLRQRGLEGLGMSPGWASGTMLAMDLGVNAGAVFAPSLMAREGGAWPSVERVGARRQVQNLRLISAMDANRQFVRKGQFPPFAEGTFIRQFDAATELQFVRVHSALNPRGGWLVRAEEIRGLSPQQIQQRLALPEVPTHIQVVTVPRGTTMQVGRAGAQPQWGIPNKGAFQYRVEGILPEFSFGLSVPIPK